MTLSKQGAFADALVVGRKLTQLGADVDKLKESMTAVRNLSLICSLQILLLTLQLNRSIHHYLA